jgi:hypothetical protein
MRASMSRSSVSLLTLTIAVTAGVACNPDLPTGAAESGPAYARQAGVSYTTALLPLLAGDNTSRANGVNDAGEVVGYSCCSQDNRAFVTLGGAAAHLAGDNATAMAISNGTPRYVVGRAGSPFLPVRWTITGNTPDQPAILSIGTAVSGEALGVNDAGETVGRAGANAAMWDASGNLTVIPSPSDYTRGEARDINNTGDAVLVFSRSGPVWNGMAIGYVRVASGALIALPPLTSGGISYANTISAANNGQLQIAGSSYSDQSSPHAVRWTVDIASGQIVSAVMRPEVSHLTAIADAGSAAGFLEGPSGSLKYDAFRWDAAGLLKLAPPGNGKRGIAWAISPNARLIAGEATVSLVRRAVLWTMPAQ